MFYTQYTVFSKIRWLIAPRLTFETDSGYSAYIWRRCLSSSFKMMAPIQSRGFFETLNWDHLKFLFNFLILLTVIRPFTVIRISLQCKKRKKRESLEPITFPKTQNLCQKFTEIVLKTSKNLLEQIQTLLEHSP